MWAYVYTTKLQQVIPNFTAVGTSFFHQSSDLECVGETKTKPIEYSKFDMSTVPSLHVWMLSRTFVNIALHISRRSPACCVRLLDALEICRSTWKVVEFDMHKAQFVACKTGSQAPCNRSGQLQDENCNLHLRFMQSSSECFPFG